MSTIDGMENVPPPATDGPPKTVSADGQDESKKSRAEKLLEYLRNKKQRDGADSDTKIAPRIPLGDSNHVNGTRTSLGSISSTLNLGNGTRTSVGSSSGLSHLKSSPDKRATAGPTLPRPPTPTGATLHRPPTPVSVAGPNKLRIPNGQTPPRKEPVATAVPSTSSNVGVSRAGASRPIPVRARATSTSPRSPPSEARWGLLGAPDRRRPPSASRPTFSAVSLGKSDFSARHLEVNTSNAPGPALVAPVALTSAQLKRHVNPFEGKEFQQVARGTSDPGNHRDGSQDQKSPALSLKIEGGSIESASLLRRDELGSDKKISDNRKSAVSHKNYSRPRVSPPRVPSHPYKLSPRRRGPSVSPSTSRSRPTSFAPTHPALTKRDRLAFTLDQVFAASSPRPPPAERAVSPATSDPEPMAVEELHTASGDELSVQTNVSGLLGKCTWNTPSDGNLSGITDRARTGLPEQSDAIEKSNSHLSVASERLRDLERQLAAKESECAALIVQKENLVSAAKDREEQVDKLGKECKEAQESLQRLRKELEQSSDKSKDVERTKVALRDAEKQVLHIKLTLSGTEKELDRTKIMLKEVGKEVGRAKESAEKASAEAGEWKAKVFEIERMAKARTEAAFGEVSRLEKEVSVLVATKEEIDRRQHETMAALEAMTTERDTMAGELSTLRDKHQLAMRDYILKVRELERLRSGEVAQVKAETEARINEQWEARLLEQQQQRADECAMLRAERDAARADITQAARDLDEAHELISQLAEREHWIRPGDLQKLHEDYRRAQEEARNLRRSMNELDEKLEVVEANCFKEETTRLAAEEKARKAEDKVAELVDELTVVMRDSDELAAQVRARDADERILSSQIGALREQVAALQRSHTNMGHNVATQEASTGTDHPFDLRLYENAEKAIDMMRTLLIGNAEMYQRMHANHEAYNGVVEDLQNQIADLERTNEELLATNYQLVEKLREVGIGDASGAKGGRTSRAGGRGTRN
ncbi:hypothetical protein HDU93_002200 [Gonapodya sp. JEL0774]|nr:hypothetical protein HDU93_002200 [Gonapodya sp. JEL0774]